MQSPTTPITSIADMEVADIERVSAINVRGVMLATLAIGAISGIVFGLIPALASTLPLVSGTAIPKSWPDDRYDVIWTFTLTADARYAFGQVPQLLLSGDADTVIG